MNKNTELSLLVIDKMICTLKIHIFTLASSHFTVILMLNYKYLKLQGYIAKNNYISFVCIPMAIKK